MMIDVDSLGRRYGPLIAHHCMLACILHRQNEPFQPQAYISQGFHNSNTSKLTSPEHDQDTTVLCSSFITAVRTTSCSSPPVAKDYSNLILSSSLVLYVTAYSIF